MKRVSSAMLQQTLRFVLNDKLSHEEAVEASAREAEEYISRLKGSGMKYCIVRTEQDPDGATIIEVKKQYGSAPTGSYI